MNAISLRARRVLGVLAIGIVVSGLLITLVYAAVPASQPGPLYTNLALDRLHKALFLRLDRSGRSVGLDEVDPLLWPNTRHLSTGASNESAIQLLDDLVRQPAADIAPLARAVLQHDLWAIFDWTTLVPYEPEGAAPILEGRNALRPPLTRALHHLAFDKDQVAKLPDNYRDLIAAKTFPAAFDPAKPDAPFLPADLFDAEGPWVCAGTPRREGPSAIHHANVLSGRSVFLVFVNLPAGRKATLEYLEKLSSVPNRTTPGSRDNTFALVQGLPQFPVGTQFALVRRMMLLDAQHKIIPTAITQGIQLRVYLKVRPGFTAESADQQSFEFTLDRRSLLAGKPGLRLVGPTEMQHINLNNILQPDPFEAAHASHIPAQTVMQSCHNCHSEPGIYSVNTFSKNFSGRFDPHLLPSDPDEETNRVIKLKSEVKAFGILQGLTEGLPR